MNIVGIVALSLLIGAFILAIVGLSAWLVWLLIRLRRDVAAFTLSCTSFIADTGNLLTLHRTEIRSAFANADQSLSQRLSEFDEAVTRLGAILESHREKTDASIESINGKELSKAVAQFGQLINEQRLAAQRTERAATLITSCTKQWLAEGAFDSAPPVGGVDADGYAAASPGEPPYVSRSRTAIDDAAVIQEESADVTQTQQP